MLQQLVECLPRAAFVWGDEQRVVALNRLSAQALAIAPGDVLRAPVPEATWPSPDRHCWTTTLTNPSGQTFEAELAAQRVNVDGRWALP